MKVWFTSDTHYGHSNILKFCPSRKYLNAAEMDRALIDNWNQLVAPEDTVYHLGDVSYHSKNRTQAILDQLHGIKHLIPGNHDYDHDLLGLGWASVNDYKELTVKDAGGNPVRLVLSHYPMREWNGYFRGTIHLYGHVHNQLQQFSNTMDMSVDTWNMYPTNIDMILERARTLDSWSRH